ncbi:TnsD family Tn7-like transposition protein [Chitinolyticbacter meiyuanensis]|uniref:TnsD family Tn7-like transposition protein n=1 Tax=Chitinolyticbacter meiyuanensis TaxID=682798 RepID=UPI0011E5E423
MPLLPKPYPDEVIGSVLVRAIRHTGLPSKRLLTQVFGIFRSRASFLMVGAAKRVGSYAGMDPEELVLRHTMFPYAVAFMPADVRAALKTKVLALSSDESLSSLTKSISYGVPYKRVCVSCIADDLERWGESYWRRSHQLPAVLFCPEHGTRLHDSSSPLKREACMRTFPIPHQGSLQSEVMPADAAAQGRLERLALRALRGEVPPRDDWLEFYRESARALGYLRRTGDTASAALASALEQMFGQHLLQQAGCSLQANRSKAWPARMVRVGSGIPFAPAKHVFLQSFFECGLLAASTLTDAYRPPGKAARDATAFDISVERRLGRLVQRAAEKGERLSVRGMLSELGAYTFYRHNRDRMPRTQAFLNAFKLSDQSERQIGLRAAWRGRSKARTQASAEFRERYINETLGGTHGEES